MTYLLAFLFAGFICGLGQIILDNTKLTPGHITSIFTVIGALLSFLGIYDKLIEYFGAGATILISNFGNMLYKAGLTGLRDFGFIGIFKEMLSYSSLAITSAICFSFVFALIFNSKD